MNDSLIKDIGRSYIVSSLLPASFFVLLAVFIFRDFLPPFMDIISQNAGKPKDPTIVISSGIIVLAFNMWVAFMLYSSVDFVVKLYEGYSYPILIKIPLQMIQYLLQRWRLRTYIPYKIQRDKFTKITEEDKRNTAFDGLEKILTDAKNQVREHEISGPLENNWKIFLPTSLGNVLLASELYPYEKYNLNGSMLFPRMSMVFPPEFTAALEEKNNQLMFILNSSLLSYLLGILALFLGWVHQINFLTWHPIFGQLYKNYLETGFKHTPTNHYMVVGCFFILAGYGIYRISINTVKEYALFVRTSFDLYRFKVLRELNHPIPTSLKDERVIWNTISEFLVYGHRFGQKHFEYQLKPDLASPYNKKRNRR